MTEFVTAPDGARIAYEVVGSGPPVVLVHGFGSNRQQNWRAPGWYDVLTAAGYSVIALDNRGHGDSDKPHESSKYGEDRMAEDVALVMQAAGAKRTFVMGYSMGGALTLRLAWKQPERLVAAITGGVGATYFTRDESWRAAVAHGLTADDTASLTPVQRMFRNFARQPGKDPVALAACMRAPRQHLSREDLATMNLPMLVVCGETDDVSGPPGPLASALGNARAATVSRRDHMLTVGDKLYKRAVLEFLVAHKDKPGVTGSERRS